MAGCKIALAGLLALSPMLASGQESQMDSTLKLDAVVVTGTRTEKRLSEAPVLTTVVTRREVEKAGATSFLEALEDNIPGIVTEANGMGNNLRIKGLNSRYILFLVDGERLVSEGAGGNVNLDQIDVNSIRRVEVINGAASALYGSNAVGAVINIITREPEDTFSAGVDVKYKSHNTLNARAFAESALQRMKTQASIFRNSSDGFGGNGKGAYAAKYADWGGNLKLGFRWPGRVDANVSGRYFRHESFNPEGSLNTTHPLTHTLSLGTDSGYASKDSRYRLKASVNFDKYYDMDWYERNAEAKLANTASYISTRILNTLNPSEKWEIVAGAEQNHEENYATRTLGPEPTHKALDDINLFGQAQWTPLAGFDIVGGGRFTHNYQFGSVATPKLSLMYRRKDLTLRAGTGTAFRAPSIKELYYNFDHQGMFWVYGNPDLKPEHGLYNSVSAEYNGASAYASATAYRNDIQNKITQYESVNTLGGLEKYYKNVSSATIMGIDLNISLIFWKHLFLKGSYSLCDAEDNATGDQLSGNVRHSGTASATWNGMFFHGPWSLQLAGRFSSPRLYQSDGEKANSKSYNIWKATFTKQFRLGRNILEMTLKCDNIFNFKDATFIDPGRQYLAGIRYTFK
ncbi:MAG: TonB-dependent receptor [Bacteroidales bacterium]|nr:TonB-dependent receptor [Bacteroidales bacterium]